MVVMNDNPIYCAPCSLNTKYSTRQPAKQLVKIYSSEGAQLHDIHLKFDPAKEYRCFMS